MPLVVQKFGGTSVADPEKILAAARKAIRAQQDGKQVVVCSHLAFDDWRIPELVPGSICIDGELNVRRAD